MSTINAYFTQYREEIKHEICLHISYHSGRILTLIKLQSYKEQNSVNVYNIRTQPPISKLPQGNGKQIEI